MPVMRPRMYGSTDRYRLFASTCPSVREGMGDCASEKSDSFGKPTGRSASLNCRFTLGNGPSLVADIGLHYLKLNCTTVVAPASELEICFDEPCSLLSQPLVCSGSRRKNSTSPQSNRLATKPTSS